MGRKAWICNQIQIKDQIMSRVLYMGMLVTADEAIKMRNEASKR